ncbi:MAG TPA: acyl-CoA desaturase [Gemmatimonadales bacterium]|nr:acyl-CoA desaturase [Gemmatimonadales bacterium]
MTKGCPRFPIRDGNAFLQELRVSVDEYFAQSGISQKANFGRVLGTACLLVLSLVTYGLILSNRFSPIVMLALTGLLGLGIAGIGFTIGHDAVHGAYSEHEKVNRVLGWSFDLVGGSSYLWRITHNVIHHTYTNIHGADEDLSVSPLLRLSPHAPRHWFQRWQAWYAIPLYAMTTLFWVFVKDYKYLAQKDLGPYANCKHSWKDLAGVAIGKVIYYGWSLVIPFMVVRLPWWQIAIGILTAHAVAGLALGIVFQLAHVVQETMHPEPDEQNAMPQSWVVHELATTANFAPTNSVLNWYVGGLNFQVEHHLLPKVCSVHYPALSPMVRELAVKHGLPYNIHATLGAAIRSHLRALRTFGRMDPVPIEVQSRAEALPRNEKAYWKPTSPQ